MAEEPRREIGETIRLRRQEAGLTLTQLAERADVSKSYLSNLETQPEHKKPSAETLYAIAKALGTTMSDLLGRRLLSEAPTEPDPALLEYARDAKLNDEEVRQLASIQWRGNPPRSTRRWHFVHESLKASSALDAE